ncbi:ATP-binding protein [Sphingomonas sp.]|uniref:ATP-binding protein n=1 Tax=Sphingomonas sp. TaxID=28214 RepID=UPI003B0084E6
MRSPGLAIAGATLVLVAGLLAMLARADALALTLGVFGGIGAASTIVGLRHQELAPTPEPPAAFNPTPGLDALIGAVADPLLIVEDGRVLHANAAATTLLGPHIIDEDVRLAIRHPAAADLFARNGATDRASVDLAGIGEPGRHWTLSVRDLPGDHRLVRLVDRTEHRDAERMRVDFVANASHELRTPLASLIGFIETLEDADRPEDAPVRARFLGIMAGEARRMQRLVDDLISLSRIEGDRHRAPADAVALEAVVREVADMAGDAGRDRIVIKVDDGVPPIAGDRAQISQLVSNLVGNALKYGDPARPVRVSLSRHRDTMVRLVVADEGEGIEARHLPRLTERFYRADPSRSRAGGGTGLGLAIVKHIVERHRGRLDIASTRGIGTCVTVLLPVARDIARGDAA